MAAAIFCIARNYAISDTAAHNRVTILDMDCVYGVCEYSRKKWNL